MSISASNIASSSTLNELRTQFNNLVTDVSAIEGGTISYTTLNTTNTNTTILNVKEDGTIVFEGASDDAYETTLTVVDPTADRTITFPNETGTVHTTGGNTTHTNIIIGDAGTIGSASDTDALSISSGGVVNFTARPTFAASLTIQDAGTIGVTSSTSAITIASTGIVTLVDDLILKDAATIGVTSSTSAITIASTGIVTLVDDLILKDAATIGVTSSTSAISIASTGIVTFVDDILIKDAGTIGSASDPDAISISSGGVVNISSTTANTSASDGALTVAGGAGIAADLTVGDDLRLITDASVLSFGVNSEIALTHVHDTGLLLTDSGGSPTLQLHDTGESLSSDGSKLILTSNSVAFNFPNADGTDGQVLKTDGSGTLSFVTASANTPSSADGQALGSASLEWSDLFLADSSTIQFGNDQDVILTHVPDVGLKLSHEATGDNLPIVLNLESEEDAIVSGEEIGRIDFTAGDSGGTDAILTAASIAATAEDTFAADNNSTGLAFKLGVSAAATEMFRMTHDGDFKIITDGSALGFGANNEIELTHVHNTGLLLTDSGGTPTLQFHDSNESVSSDGGHLIFTSNGVAFDFPSADGSSGQFLKTDGSGVLSFATDGANAFAVFEYTATAAQTSFSGSDDNSATLAYTAGVSTLQVLVNGVMLDASDYTATNGTAVVLSVAAAANDMIKILAVQTTNILSADMDGAELVLDADGDTSIRANTDDRIDFKLANAIDITMGANAMNILSGTTLTIDSGATITNSGTANGFGLSTGKAIVLAMLFGR